MRIIIVTQIIFTRFSQWLFGWRRFADSLLWMLHRYNDEMRWSEWFWYVKFCVDLYLEYRRIKELLCRKNNVPNSRWSSNDLMKGRRGVDCFIMYNNYKNEKSKIFFSHVSIYLNILTNFNLFTIFIITYIESMILIS